MTDTPATDESTFVCLGCIQRIPESQRQAEDEPFCTPCFEENQAKLAAEAEAAAFAETQAPVADEPIH